ncbi:L-aspartate oxidase [Ammoniphilus oxalaticus]|uniref:L-aspartate oxidase n=1 Tax=Ammoniphilus oxalaticus TaxID=66863 RepID=A0A419SG62_9BACL|nr:L-aspartate oxidase [Ammoniphilus oxalaticus]RKD22781.1 L-aspartate oxidase [Ammoniphilus oxalaticus]
MVPRYLIDFELQRMGKITTDVCVIGSGIAGLYTALQIAEEKQINVTMICKEEITESNTYYAQGGIAAVIAEQDSPVLHKEDTLLAGAGLCSDEATQALVTEGPRAVFDLIHYGTQFDKEAGQLALTREAAHSRRRILHARGDSTGGEIVRALSERVYKSSNIRVLEKHFAIDLLTVDEECAGAIIQGPNQDRFVVEAGATILATGGAGQLYRYTTNPIVATGDGVAMAYRAGAQIKDVEFVQFHPTALCYPEAPRFLISEAVRGEGAVLRNITGERFMHKYSSQLELAPRDIVARSIVSEMEKTESSFVYLDLTHESEEKIRRRFPMIHRECLKYGLNIVSDWIPVAPAAHYMMGGVKTNLSGETSLSRLFACGEVACAGVHGANRLASNSLTEAIVFGKRIAQQIRKRRQEPKQIDSQLVFSNLRGNQLTANILEERLDLQKVMLRSVGVFRDKDRLEQALTDLQRHLPNFLGQPSAVEEYEYLNLLTCSLLVTQAALSREESRGGHYRLDFPKRDDRTWRKHLLQCRQEGITEENRNDDDKFTTLKSSD